MTQTTKVLTTDSKAYDAIRTGFSHFLSITSRFSGKRYFSYGHLIGNTKIDFVTEHDVIE